jgi:hypothetical protein
VLDKRHFAGDVADGDDGFRCDRREFQDTTEKQQSGDEPLGWFNRLTMEGDLPAGANLVSFLC